MTTDRSDHVPTAGDAAASPAPGARLGGATGHWAVVFIDLVLSGHPHDVVVVRSGGGPIRGGRRAPSTAEPVVVCLAGGADAVVAISSGFTSTDLDARGRETARRPGIRPPGPDGPGVAPAAPSCRHDRTLPAWPPRPGGVGPAVPSPGNGVAPTGLGPGRSALVSTGDTSAVTGEDLLRWWENDRHTEVAVVYPESRDGARELLCRAARPARTRPVLAVRPDSTAARMRVLSLAGAQPGDPPPVGGAGAAVTTPHDSQAAAAVLAKIAGDAQRLDRAEDPSQLPDLDVAPLRAFVADHSGDADGRLSPPEAYRLLRLAGLPMVTTRYARDELGAIGVAGDLAGRLAVKADAPGFQKSPRVGGSVLDVYGAGGACAAYRVLKARFGPALRGVSVQPMVDCGRELFLGVREDPASGPLVVFGPSGDGADRTARPAPRTAAEADLLLDDLRSSRALWASGLDRDAVREVVLMLAWLARGVPELAELDLDPLAVHAVGCVAVDVRVRLGRRAVVHPFRLPTSSEE